MTGTCAFPSLNGVRERVDAEELDGHANGARQGVKLTEAVVVGA